MIKISACILAKNEEENIAECIRSVKPYVDEVIVVDNGSTDNTGEIAESLGSIVLDGSNLLLDSARKLYMEKAKYDWILILDADERFGKLGEVSLKEFLSRIKDNIWGYGILSYQHSGLGKWAEVHILRLIRNNKMIQYNESPIHSSVAPSIFENGAEINDTSLFAIHHLDILIKGRPVPKRKRYRTMLEEILSNKNRNLDKDTENMYKCFLGLEYVAVGEYDKAEKIYEHAVEEDFKYRNFALECLCQLYMYRKKYEKVKKYITDKNILLFRNNAVLGNYYNYFDKEKAADFYENIIKNSNATASDYLNLAYLLKDKDRIKARELLEKAVEKNSYLLKRVSYDLGEKQNLFIIQSNILFEIENVYNLFEDLKMSELING